MRDHRTTPNSARRRLEAYEKLGISPNAVAIAPKVTPLLRKLPGGEDAAIAFIRSSSDPDARRFCFQYDDVRMTLTHKRLLPIEAFCLAAGIDPPRILGIVVEQAHRQGAAIAAMIAATAHPDIMQTSVAVAKTMEGIADREYNLKHMGFLPSPKGSQVNVSVQANATMQAATVLTATPSPEDAIRKLQDKFNEGRHQIPGAEPKQLPEAIEGELVPDLSSLRERTLDAMAPILRRESNE